MGKTILIVNKNLSNNLINEDAFVNYSKKDINFNENAFWGMLGRPNAILLASGICFGKIELYLFVIGILLVLFYYLIMKKDPAYKFVLKHTKWKKLMQIFYWLTGFGIGIAISFLPSDKEFFAICGIVIFLNLIYIENKLARELARKIFE